MIKRFFLGCGLGLGLIAVGCGSDSTATAGGGGTGGTGGVGGSGGTEFQPPEFGTWIKYEPEGAVCSDGSQYAFYVEFSETSDNVIVYFMGGGGCWDYESCVGGGARGAANPNGLPDNYANVYATISGLPVSVNQVYPLLNDDPAVSPMADWNKVFVPYCTGDVYSGSVTNTYQDPDGIEPDTVFHHVGHDNVLAMTQMLNGMFATVPKLFVGGCSAGGAGAIINYYFLRTGIEGVERGYLLDDSGPIYPDQDSTSRSLPLHSEVRSVWDADTLIDTAPQPDRIRMDLGELNLVLAEEFPNDRLASTFFRLDYNFSLYSYERFWTLDDQSGELARYTGYGLGLDEHLSADRTAIHTLWWDDVSLLRAEYDSSGTDNLAYFIPYWRQTNSSHCVTIPGFEDVEDPINLFLTDFPALAWAGSEIEADGLNLRDYVDHLLSDEPLESYFEEQGEGPYVPCTPPADPVACEAAVNPPPLMP
jgi:Pectinacetylesterase